MTKLCVAANEVPTAISLVEIEPARLFEYILLRSSSVMIVPQVLGCRNGTPSTREEGIDGAE